MMKNYYLLVLIIVCSCASNPIRLATTTDKTDFGITKPTQALFFVINENLKASDQELEDYKEISNKYYNYFGGATDRLFVGRTNAKTFKFSNEKTTWYVEVNKLTKPTALVLFDGEHQPIVEYNKKNFEKFINKYITATPSQLSSSPQNTTKAKTNNNFSRVVDSIWAIPFVPDYKYADNIIKNSNTVYFPMPLLINDNRCNGKIKYDIYSDLEMKNKIYEMTNHYLEGKLLGSSYTRENTINTTKYYFNKLGLLDSITSYENNKRESSIVFKYLKDKFVVVADGNRREDFYLNNLGRVDKKVNFNRSTNPSSEQRYTYDIIGRVLAEKTYDNEKLERSIIFHYPNDKTVRYTDFEVLDANNRVQTKYVTEAGNGIQYSVSDAGKKKVSLTKSLIDKNCEGKIITYDADDKVQSVVVQTRN
ncbi:hypothetical protein [Soonwooa sp.]|uniref:hypothetical protein n=1 Tax=Soonwooa sp. TaxID=1938592 RepID=UPI0026391390|nr:hypothetical protein [Soonwooa sp.]